MKGKKFLSVVLSLLMAQSIVVTTAISSSAVETEQVVSEAKTEEVGSTYSYNGYEYSVSSGKATITKYTGSASNLTIPSTLGGYSVTKIGNSAFKDCKTLTSITIPNSVTSIEGYAFSGCTKVTSLKIGNSIDEMGSYAFSDCTSLKTVTIASGTTIIGYGAFYDCTSLTSVSIPNTVTKIGDSSFSNCTSLTSATIPNSVKSIGSSAFNNCKNMSSLSIGSGVTSIGNSAFKDCKSLTSVTIPNSVTSIEGYAFSSCTKVTSLKIGNSIDEMGSYAFSGCTSLKTVTIASGTTIIGYGAFYDCASLTSISIPDTVIKIGSVKLNDDNLKDNTVFYNHPSSMTIYGTSGSFAQKFANANSIRFSTSSIPSTPTTVSPTSVSLNKTSITLGAGESYTLTKTVSPSNASTSYTWSSSNTSVATVNSSGKITARNSGTATITVKTSNGKTATCKVTVKNAPSKISLNKTKVTLGVGETFDLNSTLPSGTASYSVKYTSNNTSVATVKASGGLVTAKKAGTVTITATTYNGKKATCTVTVKNAPSKISLNKTKVTLGVGETFDLNSTLPSGTASYSVKYTSGNTSVATVKSSGGLITAKKKGTAVITATTYNGKKATCTVTVK